MNRIKISFNTILFILYLLIIFFYLLFYGKPVLFYQAQQPSFLFDKSFFIQQSVYPGGIADYIALFLMQFFYFNWSGTLLIILLSWAIAYYTFLLVNWMYPESSIIYFVKYLPVILVLYLINDYLFPISVLIRVLFAIIGLNIFRLLPDKFNYKIIAYILISILLFYISGGPSLFLFTICAIILLLKKHHCKKALFISVFFILFASLIPYVVFKYIVNVSLADVYINILPRSSIMLNYHYRNYFYIIFGYLPLLLCIFLFFKTKNNDSTSNNRNNSDDNTSKDNTHILSWLKKKKYMITIQFFILLCITVGLIYSIDRHYKYVLLSDYYAEREEWDKVLRNAVKSSFYDVQINRDFNRALFFSGELTEKLFKYSQLSGSDGLFADKIEEGLKKAISCSDLYFDLGFINQSQHWAFEAQTLMPYNPRILKRIVVNSIIMSDYKITNKYLQVLDKNFLYHKWVKRCREFISDSNLVANDQFIQIKRTLNPDSGLMHFYMEDNLFLLMRRNSKNKMAYEYIAVYYLLNQKLDEFYRIFPYASTFGYQKIPRIFEEALLFYKKTSKNKSVDLSQLNFSENTLNDFKTFSDILRQYNGNTILAQNKLKDLFFDTYWYYIFCIKPFLNNEIKK